MTVPSATAHPLACPGCAGLDQVQRVSEVYRAGTSRYGATGWAVGAAGGQLAFLHIAHTGTTVSALAAALDPRPAIRSHRGLAVIGGLLLVCALGLIVLDGVLVANGLRAGFHGITYQAVLLMLVPPLVFAVPAAMMLTAPLRANRWKRQVAQGMPHAYTVWQRAWYCHRCGGAYLPPAENDSRLPTGRLLTASDFRDLLRHVGGFSHVS